MLGLATVRTVTAACLCTWLFACGLLALHHRATHPHRIDARGTLTHPLVAAEPAVSPTPGEHSSARPAAPRDVDHETCPLRVAPGAWVTEDAHARVTSASLQPLPLGGASIPLVTLSLYHLAPKTSPPAPC